MKPLSLHLQNWRSWETLDLDIPTGITVIRGEGGAGKSSLLDAIDTAIAAPARAGALLERNRRHGADQVVVELVLEHAGETYRIRRAQKGRKTTLDFDIWYGERADYPEWLPLTRDTAVATSELISETLGIDARTWRASSYLKQGDSAAFCEADASERRAILGQALRLDEPWSTLLARARSEKTMLKDSLARHEAAVEQGARDAEQKADTAAALTSMRENLVTARAALEHAENVLAKTTAERAHVQAQEAKRSAATALVSERASAYRSAQGKADALADQIDAARREAGDLPALEELDGMLPALEQAYQSALEQAADQRRREEAHRALVAEHTRLGHEIKTLRTRACEHIKTAGAIREQADGIKQRDDAECPTCHQTIGGDAKASTLEKLHQAELDHVAKQNAINDEISPLRVRRAELVPMIDEALSAIGAVVDVAGHRREAEAARTASQELAHARARVERARELAEEHDELVQTLPALAASVQDARNELATLPAASTLEQLRDAHANAEQAVRNGRGSRDTYAGAVERLTGLVDDLDRRLAMARAAGEEAEHARAELAVVAACERAYAADGIPALIVESIAVPQIEAEATRILGLLDTPFRVELRTQRELKDGSGTREALDLWIVGPAGETRYDDLSGSERSRANIALRIALAQLLAHQRGAEHGVLALDEVQFLTDGMYARLAEVLKELHGTFDRIVVVSHHASLRDAFDQTLEVVKDDAGASRLAEAVV